MKKALELRTAHQIQIGLSPGRTPVRMIPSGAAELFVVVAEMYNELVNTGRERVEHLPISLHPLFNGHARLYLKHAAHENRLVWKRDVRLGLDRLTREQD